MLKNVEECSRMYIVEYSSSMQMLRSTPPPLPAASVLHTFNDNSCTHSVSLKGGERFFLRGQILEHKSSFRQGLGRDILHPPLKN